MKTQATLLLLCISAAVFGQGPNVNVKKEKLYVNDTAICIVDKKKNGFLSSPSFQIKTLDEKLLANMQPMSTTLPISGSKSWYRLTFEGMPDSVQFITSDLRNFNKATMLQVNEALGEIIYRYGLVKENAINREGLDKLKEEYGADYAKSYAEQGAKEAVCQTTVRNPGISDSLAPVTVVYVNTVVATKYTTVLNYDVMQGDKKIGTIVAKGSPKGAKKEDSEYDYSPGMLDLDGASPLNYDIINASGCQMAGYIGTEKYLQTWKDGVKLMIGDIKKYNKDGVKTRLAYIQAIANYLVAKRYL